MERINLHELAESLPGLEKYRPPQASLYRHVSPTKRHQHAHRMQRRYLAPEVLGTSLCAVRCNRITQYWCGLQLDSQRQQRHKKAKAGWGSETTPCSALIPMCNEKKSNCMNELGGVSAHASLAPLFR